MKNFSLKIIKFSEEKIIQREYTLGDILNFGFRCKMNEFIFLFFPDRTFIAEGLEHTCLLDWKTLPEDPDYYLVHSHPYIEKNRYLQCYPSIADYTHVMRFSPTYDNFIFTYEGITRYVNPMMNICSYNEDFLSMCEMLGSPQLPGYKENTNKMVEFFVSEYLKTYKKRPETFISWENCLERFSPDMTMYELLLELHNIDEITTSDLIAKNEKIKKIRKIKNQAIQEYAKNSNTKTLITMLLRLNKITKEE